MKALTKPFTVILSLVAAMLCGHSAGLNAPAPLPPTISEIDKSAQAIFIGRVESTVGRPFFPDSQDDGMIEHKIKVTDLLLGGPRGIPRRITYDAGRASMSEAQANARYAGKPFVFAGEINLPQGGEVEIVPSLSSKSPLELTIVGDFAQEMARQNGLASPHGHRPGETGKHESNKPSECREIKSLIISGKLSNYSIPFTQERQDSLEYDVPIGIGKRGKLTANCGHGSDAICEIYLAAANGKVVQFSLPANIRLIKLRGRAYIVNGLSIHANGKFELKDYIVHRLQAHGVRPICNKF